MQLILTPLVCSSSYHYQLFQPTRLINKLLWFVATGNQDAAEKGIKLNPELLLKRGTVTDYSGRTFTNITAFEYALWALDTRYMCNMMLDCLSTLDNETQAEMIKQGLFRQYKAFKNNNGVQYTAQDGKSHQEKHFDFLPIKTALQDYIDNFDIWDRTKQEEHWCKVVGLAQCGLPVHVRQHYCDPEESFDPTPAFDKKTFKRSLELYNFVTGKEEIWGSCGLSNLSGLGVNFGIFRAGRLFARACVLGRPTLDLAALSALCEVRTKDFVDLNDRLQNPLQKPESEICRRYA